MKSIIGLFGRDIGVDPTIQRLKQAGVPDERIDIISNPSTVNKLLGCDSACVIKNYTLWGAAIGIGIYAIFGIVAAMCECSLLQFGQEYGVGAFIGSLLAGTLVGGVIGVLVGAGEADKDTHLYVQGIRLGGKVIAVQVADEEADRVKNILAMENVRGVRSL
jgi:hypothetical protein